jgi:hypothetical protein
MADASETHVTQDIGSGAAGQPGAAYDTDRLGEPGNPGVPTETSTPPTNETTSLRVVTEALALTTSLEAALPGSLSRRNRSPRRLLRARGDRLAN